MLPFVKSVNKTYTIYDKNVDFVYVSANNFINA